MAVCKVVVQFNQFSSQAADILLELPEVWQVVVLALWPRVR